jgi:hypothetical protein
VPDSLCKPSKDERAHDVHHEDGEKAEGSDPHEDLPDCDPEQRAYSTAQEHGNCHPELRIHELGKVPVTVQHMGYSLDCSK